jgi:hypothetical protein
MKHLLTLLLATLCATGYGQTIKTLGYNTNGEVVYAGTNPLVFTNAVFFGGDVSINPSAGINYGGSEVMNLEEKTLLGDWTVAGGLSFFNTTNAAITRTNLEAARAPILAYKATNQTNATTNLVSDTALTFTAAANTKYAVEMLINTVGDEASTIISGKINAATNVAVYGNWVSYNYVLGAFPGSKITNEYPLFYPEDQDDGSHLQKFVVVGANSNTTITFQFAKTLTNAGNAIIGAGSYLKAEVIE